MPIPWPKEGDEPNMAIEIPFLEKIIGRLLCGDKFNFISKQNAKITFF
jgi:hypothetical protein